MKAEAKWSPQVLRLSFSYNGVDSEKFISRWKRTEISEDIKEAKVRHLTYTDPVTQLRLLVHLKDYKEFNAYGWYAEFENRGTIDTPIIENILPLDLTLSIEDKERVFLHHAKGSLCRMDDFLPITTEIGTVTDGFHNTVDRITLNAVGGRSSNGTLPFMNLQSGEGGLVICVGWSGQWMADFKRKDSALRIRAGMENTHLLLPSKEKIRTPRILLLSWDGNDPIAGNNLLRRMILEYYAPRLKGEPVIPPVAFNTMYAYYQKKEVSQEYELKAIERSGELGIEAYWLDACWYGEGKEWWQEAGNWFVNKDRFPSGLKPIGEAAKKKGLKFVLWFEPERVRKGSDIEGDHPEYMLRTTLDPDTMLFNLGMPEARAFITDRISKIISESGVTIYRQDFNMDPLPYWRQADPDDRVGMSEIRHIEGLYAMWDELLKRHPGLAIDNCSSGGRRIDLETVSRSFPLWRSDFSDVPGLSYGVAISVGDQSQNSGLSRWIPFHTGAAWKFKPYEFRSTMSSGVVFYYDIREKDFPVEDAKRAIEELKSLRYFFLGDFYPLHPLTVSYSDWCAFQFHRPDLDSGFAVFLRRHESPFVSMEIGLKAIDPGAEYEISVASGFETPPAKRASGRELKKINIMIPEMPGSALLRYKKI